MTNIAGFEVNGGFKKTVYGVAAAAAIGVGGYVMNAASRVAPLEVKVDGIEKQIDSQFDGLHERWNDQKAWNELLLDQQRATDSKIDQLITITRNRP